MKTKILLLIIFISLFFTNAKNVFARENVTDWYIQNFDSEIIINKDSTLEITERITADCGNAAGKHGIFRVLPEDVKIGNKSLNIPVELVGITDFSGKKVKYSETRNRKDKTVTWKIGDPNRTVQGVNNYIIRYKVKNVIRFANPSFDELYWNLTGNFWDLEIDKFHAKIVLPEGANKSKSMVSYYTGYINEKGKDLATYHWSSQNVLEFDSTRTLLEKQGVTAVVTFPKNILTPYVPSFWEKYGRYFFFLIPVIVFFVCLYLWKKYGDDPRVEKAIVPEYDAPGKLSPIELGMLMKNGKFSNEFIASEVICLATRGLINIKEISEKVLFFSNKDYELERKQNQEEEARLNETQRMILENIFDGAQNRKLSTLKNSFYKHLNDIKKSGEELLIRKKLIVGSGLKFGIAFLTIGIFLLFSSFFIFEFSIEFAISLFISGATISLFSFIMPKRTLAGAEINWQIKGFKMFMETVDKDRAKFYEKENIFEKFLPYAIVFGITDLWIKRAKEIYGEGYYKTYAPTWYAGSVSAFDADSFSSVIGSLSSDIAANTSAPSGSGGGGGAGGGGGGGGGGGW